MRISEEGQAGFLYDDGNNLVSGDCTALEDSNLRPAECRPVWSGHPGEPCYCPTCGKELFYRPWWSW